MRALSYPRVHIVGSLALTVGVTALSIVPPAAGQTPDGEILRTVELVYERLSANQGERRDLSGFAALFLPGARLTSVSGRPPDAYETSSLSVSEWIVANLSWLESRGFVEDFTHHELDVYGPVAHVLTTWVTRAERGGAVRRRGVATLQLVQTPEGWRVASWVWTGEQEGLPLPGRVP